MTRSSLLGCLLAFAGVLPLAGQAPGCEAPVSVAGSVATAAGQPLPDASVSLPALQLRLLTDARGRFLLRDVCPGAYRLRVTHLGYAPADDEYRVEAGASLSFVLRSQAVELEGIRVEVAPVMVRLEERRAAHGGRSAVFDWRDFLGRGLPPSIPEWVARRAGVVVVECAGAYWGTRECYLDRKQVRRVEVCVNEAESVAGASEIGRYPQEEIGRAEFYRGEGLLKIYTKAFLARAALGNWLIHPNPTSC